MNINWIKDEQYIVEYNYTDAWIGTIGIKFPIEVFWIGQYKPDEEYYMLIGRGHGEWRWEGTLEDCKKEALKLINE